MRYKYGAFGSGNVFWDRLKCHLLFNHDWQFLDGYGIVQQCRNCGLYRTYRTRKRRQYQKKSTQFRMTVK